MDPLLTRGRDVPGPAPGNDKTPLRSAGSGRLGDLPQRETLPALRQPVHTFMRFGVPLTVARTRWMLGLKRRFVILRDQGRLLPKPGFLAQMSQTAATVHSDRFEVMVPTARAISCAGNRTRVSEPPAPREIEGLKSGCDYPEPLDSVA